MNQPDFPHSLISSPTSIPASTRLFEQLRDIYDANRTVMGLIEDLCDFVETGEGSCECCGRLMLLHERKTCRFCTNLFRRISSIAKELGCEPPSKEDRQTIVARVSIMRAAPLDETARVYLAFNFPLRFFIADHCIDYRLLFHADNLLFFTDQAAYRTHRENLRDTPERYLRSKFITWRSSCLRVTDNSPSIRRYNRTRLLQTLAPLRGKPAGGAPLHLQTQENRR